MQAVRRKLSFANVTSMLALMIALGGTSYAATVARNSVGTAQIKKGGVKNSDLGSNAVTSAKVKNGSLEAADFKLGQLPAGAQGPRGPKGDPGSPGLQGAPGTPGSPGLLAGTIVRRTDVPLPQGPSAGVPGAITSGFATCEPGEKIVGGSANVSNNATLPGSTNLEMELLADRPSKDTVGSGAVPADGEPYAFWKGTARTLTNGLSNPALRIFAICAVGSAT